MTGRYRGTRWELALGGLLASSWVWAQAVIESVSGSLQAGVEVVRVELSQALAAEPKGFTVQSPARIALDFPGLSNGLGKSALEFELGNLRSAHIVEDAGRARLVLNLRTATGYRTERHGRVLLVFLDPAGPPRGLDSQPGAREKLVQGDKPGQGPGFSGEKLSMNFQNIEVRALLQVIADFTDFNIVASDSVSGALTLRLKEVPWDQALHIIMEAKGLGMRQSGPVLWIAPKDEIDARTRRDYEAALELQRLEPVRTQAFQLNYAKAADVAQQLTAAAGAEAGRFLSARGFASAEPRTNQLFVTDTAAKLEEIKALLATLDVPVRQVMIEARIVEARDSFGRSLGVKLGGGAMGRNQALSAGIYNQTAISDGTGNLQTDFSRNFVNLPASLANVNSTGQIALSVFNRSMTRFLSLELSAMEADGDGKIISNPRLVTADQSKALIEQGTEYPYSVTAPNGATTIAFKKAVLKLEVTPQITPDGDIILELDVNKDSRGETTTQGVAIDTKHIRTQVLVENGGTVVIGGIFEVEETRQVNKVPMLGDVPMLGHLFRSDTRTSIKREMLVFITPRMLQPGRGELH